jgi:hypothetical protein
MKNEYLHNLYCSPNIIRMINPRGMKRAGHAARMGAMKNTFKILVGKPERRRSLGRPRRRWDDNIKLNLKARVLEDSN